MSASSPLRTFFSEQHWIARFDDHILAQGKKLAKPRTVTDLRLEDLADGYLINAGVNDGEQFETELSFWPDGSDLDFETSCSCSFGVFCQHAAATLFATAKPSNLQRLLKGGTAQVALENTESPAAPKAAPVLDGLQPVFHLDVTLELANSRPVQLLLQALRTPERKVWLVARPTVSYGEHELPLLHDRSIPDLVTTGKKTVEIKRDAVAERNAIETLLQLGLTNLAANPSYRFLLGMARKEDNKQAEEANAWFPEPNLSTPDVFWPWFRAEAAAKLTAKNWQVTIDDDIGYAIYPVEPADWKTTLEELPSGWFSLSVGFDIDGQTLDLLPILAKLLEDNILEDIADLPDSGRHLIYLPDGNALHVPVGRLRNILRHLSALVDPSQPLLHPLDAVTLAEDSDLPIDPSPTLAKLAKLLRDPKAKREAEPTPPGLVADLRPYQLAGFRWMRFLADHSLHGILADDMGLGKTMQTLAHILAEKDSGRNQGKPTLVISPTSVVPNWKAEAAKFAPSLNVLVLQGSKRRKLFNTIPHADLVLTSFALLQRDIELLKKVPFHLVVLDEAQYIKNPAAKVAKAAYELQSTTRLCLSGTPIENHLGELWSLMRFLIPGFLGTQKAFRTSFQNPIEKEDDEERQQLLKERLAPLILRRTKDQVAPELPPKTILTHPIELTTEQKDLYETVRATMDTRVRDAIEATGLQQSRMVFLDALLKLRQICCEPRLLKENVAPDDPVPSAKLEYFTNLVDTLLEEGRRILVFSQFTSMLALIEKELNQREIPYLILTGSSKDRGALVDEFQTGKIPLFLISLKAGGTGLNLTAADTVIHYDPWWNPAAEAQATDRAYRIGQKNPVFVHKLICSGTVEERIQALQASKTQLADALLANTNHATTPDEETLKQLLAPLA
ncbi:MAG: DEAD/DEAH box helicase [Akkermansiaceae bacterium]|nr:DEAD/DEAH box helicase [Akkermansiaceae bacterium]